MVAVSTLKRARRVQFQALWSQHIVASAAIDPVTLDAVETVDVDITGVVGAALGDFVECAAPYDLTEVMFQAYVSAADVITLTLYGPDTGNINLASGVWKFVVKRLDPNMLVTG